MACRFFLSELNDPAGFAASLYACYPLVKPDTALELAWRYKCMDYCMPFLIQVVREVTSRLDGLSKKEEAREKVEEKQKCAPNDYVPDYNMHAGVPVLAGLGGLALMPPAAAAVAPSPAAPPSFPLQSNAFGAAALGSSSIGGGGGMPPAAAAPGAARPFPSF